MIEFPTQHQFRTVGPSAGGLAMIVLLLFSISACAAHYAIHPGALGKVDSDAYDALRIAETTIDKARLDYKAGKFPTASTAAKEALDNLIKSYNVARDSWLAYRGAIATNVRMDAYFDQLNNNLSHLSVAIRAYEEAK